jgi:hypothetical protein
MQRQNNTWSKCRIAAAIAVTLITVTAGGVLVVSKRLEPCLCISFCHYERKHNYPMAVVEMRNIGTRTACYYGPAIDAPLYDVMANRGGNWEDAGPGWCGLGSRPQFLQAGEVTRFEVIPGHPNAIWKVGLRFHRPTLRERFPKLAQRWLPSSWYSQPRTYVAWSSPIAPYDSSKHEGGALHSVDVQ